MRFAKAENRSPILTNTVKKNCSERFLYPLIALNNRDFKELRERKWKLNFGCDHKNLEKEMQLVRLSLTKHPQSLETAEYVTGFMTT